MTKNSAGAKPFSQAIGMIPPLGRHNYFELGKDLRRELGASSSSLEIRRRLLSSALGVVLRNEHGPLYGIRLQPDADQQRDEEQDPTRPLIERDMYICTQVFQPFQPVLFRVEGGEFSRRDNRDQSTSIHDPSVVVTDDAAGEMISSVAATHCWEGSDRVLLRLGRTAQLLTLAMLKPESSR